MLFKWNADFTRKLRQSRHFLLVLFRSPNCREKANRQQSNSAKKQLKIIQINININCSTTTTKAKKSSIGNVVKVSCKKIIIAYQTQGMRKVSAFFFAWRLQLCRCYQHDLCEGNFSLSFSVHIFKWEWLLSEKSKIYWPILWHLLPFFTSLSSFNGFYLNFFHSQHVKAILFFMFFVFRVINDRNVVKIVMDWGTQVSWSLQS